MKTTVRNILIVSLFICGLSFSPSLSHAYKTTAQSATKIEKNVYLFTVDYTFGMEKREVLLPTRTNREKATSTQSIAYEIVDEAGKKVAGTATGIVLSDAQLTKKGFYKTKKGKANAFRLAVTFIPAGTIERSMRLMVNHLPFNFDGKQELMLNSSELKYYKTPVIKTTDPLIESDAKSTMKVSL